MQKQAGKWTTSKYWAQINPKILPVHLYLPLANEHTHARLASTDSTTGKMPDIIHVKHDCIFYDKSGYLNKNHAAWRNSVHY